MARKKLMELQIQNALGGVVLRIKETFGFDKYISSSTTIICCLGTSLIRKGMLYLGQEGSLCGSIDVGIQEILDMLEQWAASLSTGEGKPEINDTYHIPVFLGGGEGFSAKWSCDDADEAMWSHGYVYREREEAKSCAQDMHDLKTCLANQSKSWQPQSNIKIEKKDGITTVTIWEG